MIQPTGLLRRASKVWPFAVEYSALCESGISSSYALVTNTTIAFGFKPTAPDTSKPLCDATGHYLLTIRKVGTTVTIWKQGTEIASYTTAQTTDGGLVNEVLTTYAGSTSGYFTRLVRVDDALDYSAFWELSDIVTDLWVPKRLPVSYETLLDFANAADLGHDSSGNGNDWTLTSPVQSTDTPTNNHCTLNPLDPRTAGTLSNGNLTTTGDAVVTLRPSEGKWSYKKDGAEQLYDADVSGQFDPVLAAGTYTFAGYTPTSGYKLLTAANLPEPDVLDTSLFADIVLREGTGADVAIDSLKFPPDFVNIKDRDSAYSWYVFDSVRGAEKTIDTSKTAAEEIWEEGLKEFLPTGYTLGTYIGTNQSGDSYVDLALKVGAVPGLEIYDVSHTNGTPTIINHTLGKPVTFAVTKHRDIDNSWLTYHNALGPNKYLQVSETGAAVSSTNIWPVNTSTQFALGSACITGNYIVYLFTDSDVFKAFSFTGNGNANGPFIDLGGRLLSIPFYKNTSVGSGWLNYDVVRSINNPLDLALRPDDPFYEQTAAVLSAHSTGFKAISGGSSGWPLTVNSNGGLIIGLAILRQPQKYANAF